MIRLGTTKRPTTNHTNLSKQKQNKDLPLVLRELWKTRIMKQEQVLELVAEIQDKDHIVIDTLGLILQ